MTCLSRLHGGIGVKRYSTVYYCTVASFITKILYCNEENFKNITHESHKLDMINRGIYISNPVNNCLAFEVNDDSHLASKTNFVCKAE